MLTPSYLGALARCAHADFARCLVALHAQLLPLWLTGVLVRVSDSVGCADKVADPVLPCGLLVCWYVCLILCAVLIKLLTTFYLLAYWWCWYARLILCAVLIKWLTPFYLVAYWCAGSCV